MSMLLSRITKLKTNTEYLSLQKHRYCMLVKITTEWFMPKHSVVVFGLVYPLKMLERSAVA